MLDHQFAIPPREFPEALHGWYRSIMLSDPNLRSPEQKRIQALATDQSVCRSLKAQLPKLLKLADWPTCMEGFLHEVARLPDRVPMNEFVTPTESHDIILKALEHIKALQASISTHPRLFLAKDTGHLSNELEALRFTLAERRDSAKTSGEFPAYSRADGENATRNWIGKQVSYLSQNFLGARYDSFGAAVATVISGERVTESNMRDFVPITRNRNAPRISKGSVIQPPPDSVRKRNKTAL